ncbi:MAG: hypothetical protein J6X58_04040 [Bacteroidales bacterium]|nr:hypothetical protein [Bacteroidales bacterium]
MSIAKINVKIGIDEPPFVTNGKKQSASQTIELSHVGQEFKIHCFVDFFFTITNLSPTSVEIESFADVQAVKYNIFKSINEPTDENRWKKTAKSSGGCTHIYNFMVDGDTKKHFVRIEVDIVLNDEERLALARQARDEGRWNDALYTLKEMKETKPPRQFLLRCRYQLALCYENGENNLGIKADKKLAYNSMRELFYDVKLNDAIYEEVVRTYARYRRDGIGIPASPDEYDSIINSHIIGAQKPDSTSYEGPVDEDGLPHGEGTMTYTYGDKIKKYKGNFVHGIREGEGELLYPTQIKNSMTESEYYMQGDYDNAGRQISSPKPGSYKEYIDAWCIEYKGLWCNDLPKVRPEEE